MDIEKDPQPKLQISEAKTASNSGQVSFENSQAARRDHLETEIQFFPNGRPSSFNREFYQTALFAKIDEALGPTSAEELKATITGVNETK